MGDALSRPLAESSPASFLIGGLSACLAPSLRLETETKVLHQKVASNVKVPEGQSLCQTCTYAHIVQGYAESEQLVSCSSRRWSRPEVERFAVKQCSDYVHRNHAGLCQMEKIAWVLLTKKAGRTPGFVTPREFKEIEGEDAEVLP